LASPAIDLLEAFVGVWRMERACCLCSRIPHFWLLLLPLGIILGVGAPCAVAFPQLHSSKLLSVALELAVARRWRFSCISQAASSFLKLLFVEALLSLPSQALLLRRHLDPVINHV
jgi:hypothetical protein|tara:strand:- start:34 stop:381 length:348 start_codon:yes stop_codon:yes gene_type:complete